MRCVECPCYYWDDYEEMEICHADPNWPAPCEYNDEPEEEEEWELNVLFVEAKIMNAMTE